MLMAHEETDGINMLTSVSLQSHRSITAADIEDDPEPLLKILMHAFPAFMMQQRPALEELENQSRLILAQTKDAEVEVQTLAKAVYFTVKSFHAQLRGLHNNMIWRHADAKRELEGASQAAIEAERLFGEFADILKSQGDDADDNENPILIFRTMVRIVGRILKIASDAVDLESNQLLGLGSKAIDRMNDSAASIRQLLDELLDSGESNDMVLAFAGLLRTMATQTEERARAVREASIRAAYLPTRGDKIFIIHGHAEARWRELRDLLESRFGLAGRVVVLQEEANNGRVLIEKFEKFANECCMALAIVTPDDLVSNKGKKYKQARPNVLFEIGWFYGRFGPDKLRLVCQKDTPLPSDLGGIVALEFRDQVSELLGSLQDELKSGGVALQ